jgi:hypothetical protein
LLHIQISSDALTSLRRVLLQYVELNLASNPCT